MPILNLNITVRSDDDYSLNDLYNIDRWMCSRCGFILDYQFDDEHVGWPHYDPEPGTIEDYWTDEDGQEHVEYVKPEAVTAYCPRCGLNIDSTPPILISVAPLVNLTDIMELIKQGEGRTIDFKVDIPDADKLGKVIASFANTAGGKIFVGVDDNGAVIGFKGISTPKEKETFQSRIKNIADKIRPRVDLRVNFFSENEKHIALITVFKGDPIFQFNEKIYIRDLAVSRSATPEEIIQMAKSSKNP